MSKIPVTAKSTVLRLLAARGHRAVDTDTTPSRWTTLPDGSRDWIWREDALTALMTGHHEGHLFVAGASPTKPAATRCSPDRSAKRHPR